MSAGCCVPQPLFSEVMESLCAVSPLSESCKEWLRLSRTPVCESVANPALVLALASQTTVSYGASRIYLQLELYAGHRPLEGPASKCICHSAQGCSTASFQTAAFIFPPDLWPCVMSADSRSERKGETCCSDSTCPFAMPRGVSHSAG